LMRVVAQPRENRLAVDYALKEDQHGDDMARALLITGADRAPAIVLNGEPREKKLPAVTLEGGRRAWALPVDGALDADVLRDMPERWRRAQQTLALLGRKDFRLEFLHDWRVVGPFQRAATSVLWDGEMPSYAPEQKVDLGATLTGFARDEKGNETPVEIRWKRLQGPDEPALKPGPVVLAGQFNPNKKALAYAYTKIRSDRDRDVMLYTGSDQCLAVWINGERVLLRKLYRAAAPDQDRVRVRLRKGGNTVLVKSACGWEGWSFYFRLGDEYGFPVTDGLTFGLD